MTLKEALQKLNEYQAASYACNHAVSIITTDAITAAPKQAYKGRGQTLGYLGQLQYQLLINPEMEEALNTVLANQEEAGAVAARQAELIKESYDDMTRIPMDEYVAYQTLLNEADAVWHEAKEKSDYPMFAPVLKKLIDTNKRFAALKNDKKPAYDVMLDTYEKGACMATLDVFFETLRNDLTPVILEIAKKPEPRMDFVTRPFSIAGQREFSTRLMAMEGIDPKRCTLAETEHPFTNGANKWDTRITTHYHEDDVLSSMFSVIHEGGHALYEMGVDDAYQFTALSGGTSMGLHESQSRFYENLIGRSLPFCKALLPVMTEIFPDQMKGVTAEELYAAVNRARPSLIRTEADELTYPLHVMIRYEMEKRMMSEEIDMKELPGMWNAMYKKYLGVDVPNDREGILQDCHWSNGSFGYFPSYALGSAYGVQMLRAMEKEIDVWTPVEKGDLSHITAWLGERIHRHGSFYTASQALESAIHAPFDPKVYTGYLIDKFSALYRL